jgi:MSHA pilin protein MshC
MRYIRTRGFTLIELIIVVAIMGVLSAYAIMKNASPALYTIQSQAETLAANIRHTQTLATTWSRSLRLTVTPATGTYTVACVTSGASPCNASPVVNPATGAVYSVSLERGVSIAGPATLNIDSFGKPSAAATYTLTGGGATVTVTVAAVTGFVTISL